jgi:hypothetical protein
MSTQQFHFLGVIGKPAVDLAKKCHAIVRRRKQPKEWRPPFDDVNASDWSTRDIERIDLLCSQLLDHRYTLPVMHYSSFLDAYAMGPHGLSAIRATGEQQVRAYGSAMGFALYESRHADLWREQIRLNLRRKRSGGDWHTHHVRMAMDWMTHWKHEYAIIAISECLGGSRMDADVHKSAAGRLQLPLPEEAPRAAREGLMTFSALIPATKGKRSSRP